MGKSVMSAIDTAARAVAGKRLRAVDYLRVSTEDQAKGYGIAYTGKRTAAHITKKQWEHVGTFTDEGESGTLPWELRDGATKIMELAVQTPRPFDLVCVYETRAIGRQNRVFWEWVWKLQDLGIFVAVVDEDIDNTTEEGESRMRDKANEAFKELAKIRKRTQGGIQEKAEMGGFPGGQARYGYRIANKGIKGEQKLVLDVCDGGEACTRTDPCESVHEADVLRFARNVAVRVKNWRKVALYLNAEGFFTRSGKPWTHANIRGRLLDEDLLNARYVFRNEKNGTQIGPDGTPVWGESVTIPLPPMFTPAEVAALRAATDTPTRRSPVEGRVYPLSGRLLSLCGGHYVGGSPADSTTLHYVCSGKTEEYAGAGACSCPQVWAQGVEAWAWENVCGLLGDRDRLLALADEWVGSVAKQQIDYSSRLASLDQKIAEKRSTIDLMMAVAAKQVISEGLTGRVAEAAVERKLKPLNDELAQLISERTDVETWQNEAQLADQRAKDLHALAQTAHGRLDKFTTEEQAEWLSLLDIKVKILETPPPMHRGLACPIGEWFRENDRLVPTLTDEMWEEIAAAEKFPHGGLKPRQRGGLAPRAVFEAFLKKARTGAAWPELDAEHGSTGLIGHWKRWSKQGRWDRVMWLLRDCDGVPVAPRHRLPKMEMTGKVRPGVILAATSAREAGDLEGHVQESDPWAAACCSSGRRGRAAGRWWR
ncbi:recombinase family protein [Streptomyces sp. SID8381]|uniref:recombinase family protein n=1 Tax=unclassified Streptomyces TaxID=2593676 RepID=UPI000361AA9C|nr:MULTISPECIES: recombinase family protein [unclassified Streptomyces]MYX26016.1 recombinase family protein [Streptomyces sp. SID8381]